MEHPYELLFLTVLLAKSANSVVSLAGCLGNKDSLREPFSFLLSRNLNRTVFTTALNNSVLSIVRFCGSGTNRRGYTCSTMALGKIKDVDIDRDGVFKYVLLEVKDKEGKTKNIVRGYEWAQYHGNCVCDNYLHY